MSSPVKPRAVITGAASGLGRALALDVVRRGGRVVIADIDRTGAEETARLARDTSVAGGGLAGDRTSDRALVVECDVRDADAVDALARRAEDWLGEVDLVANNAGVAVGGPFEDISLDDWRWAIDINLWGVVHGCRAFFPAMKQRGRGYILNVASAAGLMSMPMLSPYNVSKAGVVALSETLHGEGKRHGVHVTVLCPTFFATSIARSARDPFASKNRELVERMMQRSHVQAPDVARSAIDAVLAGKLYALPMRDGRLMWRLERASPALFYRVVRGPIMAMVQRWIDA